MITDSEELRWRIFDDLMSRSQRGATPLTRQELLSYAVDGESIKLLDTSRGIRNVGKWDHTLSILTSERGPYQDRQTSPGVWQYPYELTGQGEPGPSNAKLRRAMTDRVPVLYFYSPRVQVYLLIGLVHVVADDEAAREFTIALADLGVEPSGPLESDARQWITREVDQRLHQPRFREIVVPAYQHRCAVCELPVPRLLEAAHIRPDKDSEYGQPWVENGLSLCRNHHRAYDRHLIGIDSDQRVHVHPDLAGLAPAPALDEVLLKFDQRELKWVPPGKRAPDPKRLDLTYADFTAAHHTDLATL